MNIMVSPMKRVRFSEAKCSFFIDHSSAIQGKDLWYTVDDFEQFRAGGRFMVNQFIGRDAEAQTCPQKWRGSAHDGDEDGWCLRGLERLSRKSSSYQHVQAILELQKEHRATGVIDPKGVSMLSKTLSKSDRKLASLFGAVDKKEVDRIWGRDNNNNKNNKDKDKKCHEALLLSEYFQLSAAIVDQSTDAPILLNEGMRFSPRPPSIRRTSKDGDDDPTSPRRLQLCVVRRRAGESKGAIGPRAA